ncbi:MAG: histidine phosphatase family protein [Patescibacteria group bacterium]
MAIYFARHGKTEFGEKHCFEGVSDSNLTILGKDQARRLGEMLKDKNINRIISSPRGRAQQTAEIVSQILKIDMEIDETWREMSYGQWDGQAKENLKNLPEWSVREKNKYYFLHPGVANGIPGESYDHLYNIIKPAIEKLKEDFPKENIVIISHIGILRSVNKHFNNLSSEEITDFSPSNEEMIKLTKGADDKIKLEIIKY